MKQIPPMLATVLWASLALPAVAQDAPFVPALFDVSGVAANDVLNVRAEPSAEAPILATLAPDAAGVEVTALNPAGTWGRVGLGEGDGWISMAYLAPAPWPAGDIPAGMSCSGTEPFWSVTFGEGTARYATPETTVEGLSLTAAATPVPPGRQTYGFEAAGDGLRLSGVVTAGACSDGMSDRSWGWTVTLLRTMGGQADLQPGCCTLAAR